MADSVSGLIERARAAGFTLGIADRRLDVSGPSHEIVIVEGLRQQVVEVHAWLRQEAVELDWRERAFRELLPPRGPIPQLSLVGAGSIGCCLECHRRTVATGWGRCAVCLLAIQTVLGWAPHQMAAAAAQRSSTAHTKQVQYEYVGDGEHSEVRHANTQGGAGPGVAERT
jgi:hypothetical protein